MSDKKTPDPKTYKFDTLSLHAGYQPHKNAGSRQVPIYQTTSYLFDDVDHAAALFNLERGGHIYSRISNPTVGVLEERVASLEGGTAALATSTVEDGTPGYLAVLYKATHATSESLDSGDIVSTNDYVFDYKTGIVQFLNADKDPSYSEYVYMTVYQYDGKTFDSCPTRFIFANRQFH